MTFLGQTLKLFISSSSSQRCPFHPKQNPEKRLPSGSLGCLLLGWKSFPLDPTHRVTPVHKTEHGLPQFSFLRRHSLSRTRHFLSRTRHPLSRIRFCLSVVIFFIAAKRKKFLWRWTNGLELDYPQSMYLVHIIWKLNFQKKVLQYHLLEL